MTRDKLWALERLLANRFEVGERVGKGSLSVVHDAIDRETGRRVAIKLAEPGFEDKESVRQRFDREAAALSVIQSAHVVELIWAGADEEGMPFLVLERLMGHNLQELISQRGPVKPERLGRYVGQAAMALELAHGLGIVHRDLKPANLFLHEVGDGAPRVLKVLDFGLVVDTGGPTERMRDAFGGTPLYMAPEQARGQLTRIGPPTDIYAIAHVTLTALTGETYWADGLAEDVMREIESGVSAKPSQRWPWLTDAFDQWFLRSTQRVPERRYRSVVEQAARLVEALRGLRAPDQKTPAPSLMAASTIAARTPTPSIVKLAGHRTPVIGRQVEYREIDQLLARGKLITLTGAAGVGKTRLAQAICETVGERFIDGTWFVRLVAGAGEGERAVLEAIANALSIEPDATRSLFDHVVDSLAPRRMLIVLDGAEHITGSEAVVEQLVRSCPAVTWLATSRAPLGISNEVKLAVEPLDVPPAGDVTRDEAETYAAVVLFVSCAREVTPMFALTDENVGDVVAICRAVAGSPLAIEIAAAQIASSKPAQIRAGLERGAHAGSVVRHAIMSSYSLLSPDQQRVLRQLAILPAGLTFEQVKKKLGHLSDDPMYAVLRLVQTHLATWSSDTPRRLRMLDTVRELARELSEAAGEDERLWQFACDHARAIATSSVESTTDAWLAQIDVEYENLRAVLGYLLQVAPTEAMELAGRLAYFWYLRGNYADGTRWLETAIARSSWQHEDATQARALLGAGRLALLTCQYAHAQDLVGRARSISLALADLPGEASADQLLGSIARELGDYTEAHAFHARSLDIWQRIGDSREEARARNYLAFAAWIGDYAGMPSDELLAWWDQIDEAQLRALGDPEIIVWYLLNRGAILHHKGDPASRDVLGRAFAESVAARFYEGIAWSLDQIGRVSLERGELLQARAQLAASLRVHRRLGDRWRCASVLEALASVSVASGRPARGAVYLGAADTIRDQIGTPVPACERPMLASTEARGVDMIGQAFDAGRERGHRTSLDQTIELSRDVV